MSQHADFYDLIKSRVDIRTEVEKDVKLKQSGKRLLGLCPFHTEKSPSFYLYPDAERYHCYGCGRNGDVIDYVAARRSLSVWEAATALAAAVHVPMPRVTHTGGNLGQSARPVADCLTHFAGTSHRHLLQSPACLQYLEGRGIGIEVIKEYQIGLAKYSGIDEGAAKECGLISEDGKALLSGRITFPILKGGKIVNICSRQFESKSGPKYLNLKDMGVIPFNAHLLKHDRVILCEGVIDAILLCIAGHDAVATIGTYFKTEWLTYTKPESHYICCYDNDANEAGQRGADRIASYLWNAGRISRICQLPEGDPADLICNGKAAEVERAIADSKPYIDYRIDEYRFTTEDVFSKNTAVNEVFSLMGNIPEIGQESYVQRISKAFVLKPAAVRAAWDSYRRAAPKEKAKIEPSETSIEPVFRDENPILFNPAQAFIGSAMFTVYCESSSGDLAPFIIGSDRTIVPLTKDVASAMGMIFRQNKFPTEQIRWPVGTRYPNSVPNWVSGNSSVDTKEMYLLIRSLIKKHIYWEPEDEGYYDLVSIWIIGTYLHQLFDSFPYIHLRAISGSGKTTLLRIIEGIAFNAAYSASTTESVVSRLVNSDSSTLCIDEAEGYRRKPQEDQTSFIFEVLNAGYKQGATVRKASDKKNNYRPESFDVYSPKILASIESIDDTLSTRCIQVRLIKSPRAVDEFLPQERAVSDLLLGLRGTLYCWALMHWETVRDCYDGSSPAEDLRNRNWELWKPIIALSYILSGHIGEDLTGAISTLAKAISKAAEDSKNDLSSLNRICRSIMDYMYENPSPDNWYAVPYLVERVRVDTGWKEFTPERLSRFLFDEARFCKDRKADKKRKNTPLSIRDVQHVRIEPENAKRMARDLFAYEDDRATPVITKEFEDEL